MCAGKVHCNWNKNACFMIKWTLKRQAHLHCSILHLHWTVLQIVLHACFCSDFLFRCIQHGHNFWQINCYYRIAKTFIVKTKIWRERKTEDEQAHTNLVGIVYKYTYNIHVTSNDRMKEKHLFFSHSFNLRKKKGKKTKRREKRTQPNQEHCWNLIDNSAGTITATPLLFVAWTHF